MYVIAGATGRVGSAAATHLLDAGAPVRVLVRRPADAATWRERGADAAVVDLGERAGLVAALSGASGFFVLLPFDLTADDLDAYAERLAGSIAGAVAESGVPHVVMLSSAGADLADGTGPITGIHRLEEALAGTGAVVTALRSGHFQEKVTDVLEIARADGVFPVFASSADVANPMVATADLGALVSATLLAPPAVSETVDVVGPSYTEREVAASLGTVLGRDLHVITVPAEAWEGAFHEAGFPPHVAASLAEMHQADERGLLVRRGDRSVPVHTGIEATFAQYAPAAMP